MGFLILYVALQGSNSALTKLVTVASLLIFAYIMADAITQHRENDIETMK